MYVKISKACQKLFEVTENGLSLIYSGRSLGNHQMALIISCHCCTKDVLEIKCLYCHWEESIEVAAANDRKFCLKENNGSLYCYHHSHPYFYQVQTQIFVCYVLYCDFCIILYTFANGQDKHSIHIERNCLCKTATHAYCI